MSISATSTTSYFGTVQANQPPQLSWPPPPPPDQGATDAQGATGSTGAGQGTGSTDPFAKLAADLQAALVA
jgi:hypothetical protein